jgi:DNA repair ATPase RecN
MVPTLVNSTRWDAGIGGEIGARVGDALGEVAELASGAGDHPSSQIAAKADRHLGVAKRTRGGLATRMSP